MSILDSCKLSFSHSVIIVDLFGKSVLFLQIIFHFIDLLLALGKVEFDLVVHYLNRLKVLILWYHFNFIVASSIPIWMFNFLRSSLDCLA